MLLMRGWLPDLTFDRVLMQKTYGHERLDVSSRLSGQNGGEVAAPTITNNVLTMRQK
jgi:hypothetical protein